MKVRRVFLLFTALTLVLVATGTGATSGAQQSGEGKPAALPQPESTTSEVSLETRLAQVDASSVPGVQRNRLELATRLAELGPGGPRAQEAVDRGASISGIAVTANGLEVTMADENDKAATEAVVQAELKAILLEEPQLAGFGDIGYSQRVITVTDLSTPGGWMVSHGAAYCSLNATTYNYYLGVRLWHWMTAGHCSPVTPGSSAVDGPFNWQSGSATGASDSGLWYIGSGATVPSAAASTLTDGFTGRWIANNSDRPQFDQVGTSQVCLTGATSGTGCGTLIAIWVTPIRGVYYIRETNYAGCLGGDSGGPWFGRYLNGTVSLMGVLKGVTDDYTHCIYSDEQLALNDRGVSLHH